MKKILHLLLTLTLAMFTSACINTVAIQKLNEIAAKYLEDGDIPAAISRLESSIDLDGNIYQSRYNLATCYLRLNQCDKALEQIKIAQSLAPYEPAVYYTLGVSYNCAADLIYNKKNENGEDEKIEYNTKEETEQAALKYMKYIKEANNSYNKYLELAPNTDQTQEITNLILKNNEIIYHGIK